jgi:hypothetical protein
MCLLHRQFLENLANHSNGKDDGQGTTNVDFGYWIMMTNTGILAIKSRDNEWLISDVTEINLQPNTMNWEFRLSLSEAHNSNPFLGTHTHTHKVCEWPLPPPRASLLYKKTQYCFLHAIPLPAVW